jgi:UDP-galactopyranose mutase
LTWEYPDEYFEYYWKDINLYFFWNKLYSDLIDIFEVLTYELPFSINKVNNFWEKSFYINLNSGFEDEYVRVVLKKSNRIIWFKIKKQLYKKMKWELWAIFHK